MLANAERKLREKHLDLIVANDVAGTQTGFEVDTNSVTMIDRHGHRETVPLMSKDAVADRILDHALRLKQAQAATSSAKIRSVASAGRKAKDRRKGFKGSRVRGSE